MKNRFQQLAGIKEETIDVENLKKLVDNSTTLKNRLQTVNNAPASNLVKNAQDFIVLLKAICAINLYIEKKPILIDLTIKNNDDTKKKQLKIELMDATKGKEEIDKITK